MRLYLKLALIVGAAVLIQSALRPAGRCAWEVQFAARCWLAHHLEDTELQAQLVEEGQKRLVQDLKRAWEAERPVVIINAAAAGPPTAQPLLLPLDIDVRVVAIVP